MSVLRVPSRGRERRGRGEGVRVGGISEAVGVGAGASSGAQINRPRGGTQGDHIARPAVLPRTKGRALTDFGEQERADLDKSCHEIETHLLTLIGS